MRERILSNVLLPAPLRPMMPRTSPRLTSKLTSLRAQNSSTVSPTTMARPRAIPAALRQRLLRAAGQHVAQRDVALAFGGVADQVFLAEPLGADDDVARSSLTRSGRLQLTLPEIRCRGRRIANNSRRSQRRRPVMALADRAQG